MSTSRASDVITVTVPATFRISVAVPGSNRADQRVIAEAIAACAAEHFAHVSEAQIRAFNEVNRIHPHGVGMITAVISSPDSTPKTTAV